MIEGTDVSSHQGAGWKPRSVDDFCFIKISEGTGYVNPDLDEQWKTTVDAGLVVGGYCFMHPGNPKGQAQTMVNNTPKGGNTPIYVCDWEPTGDGTASESDKNAFIAEVQRLRPDSRVLLYCNASMWKSSDKKRGDGLWIAHYTSASKPDADGDDWLVWQWSDDPIDKNRAQFSSRSDMRSWAGGSSGGSSGVLGMTKIEKFSYTGA